MISLVLTGTAINVWMKHSINKKYDQKQKHKLGKNN